MGKDNSEVFSRHLSSEELERRIDDTNDPVLQQRLVFVRNLYRGDTIKTAAQLVGKDERTGRRWLTWWNQDGVRGLRPDVESADQSALAPTEKAEVEYLNYEVLVEHGWELDDDNLFEKAATAELDAEDHGTITVERGDFILEAAEDHGFTWPYSCRGGACANCAAILKEGEIDIGTQQILPEEAIEVHDARLTCIGTPITETVKIIYNAKHKEYLQELVLPPQQSETTNGEDRSENSGFFDSFL